MPRLKKARKQELFWNYTQTHMQLHLRVAPTKIIFSFQTSAVFLPPFFKYHVVFHDQSVGYTGEHEIIDMIEVIEP